MGPRQGSRQDGPTQEHEVEPGSLPQLLVEPRK